MTESDKERLGRLMKTARESADCSRDALAAKTSVTAGTIKNWETGASAPDMVQFFEYFSELGVNPQRTIDAFIYPELENLRWGLSDEEIDRAFDLFVSGLSPLEKRQILFMRSSEHGGDWFALLQMVVAHLQTPMAVRYAVSQLIASQYQVSVATGSVACPDNVQPNMEVLDRAIESGKNSAINGLRGYFLKME